LNGGRAGVSQPATARTLATPAGRPSPGAKTGEGIFSRFKKP
jgi:hypothetical protein